MCSCVDKGAWGHCVRLCGAPGNVGAAPPGALRDLVPCPSGDWCPLGRSTVMNQTTLQCPGGLVRARAVVHITLPRALRTLLHVPGKQL